jgi:cysteinyl-tRNA synthetase
MMALKSLISSSNSYLSECSKQKSKPNADVLVNIATFITKFLRMLGVFKDSNPDIGLPTSFTANVPQEELVLPFVHVLSEFRNKIRALAQNKAEPKEFLKLCDLVRDEELVDLGVSLEDREDGKALVKLMDKLVLKQIREEKKQKETLKQKEKEQRAKDAELKRLEKLKKGSVSPQAMFKTEESLKEFSAWDEQGIPTKDQQGVELSKSKRKKLEKEFSAQKKLHQEYLQSLKK